MHVTLAKREDAALWHATHTPAERRKPTPRSANVDCGPNLLQIQSKAVADDPSGAQLHSIGISTADVNLFVAQWTTASGTVVRHDATQTLLTDPWGLPIELVSGECDAYSHINITADDPKALRDWYAHPWLVPLPHRKSQQPN